MDRGRGETLEGSSLWSWEGRHTHLHPRTRMRLWTSIKHDPIYTQGLRSLLPYTQPVPLVSAHNQALGSPPAPIWGPPPGCFSLQEFLIPSAHNTLPDQACTSLQARVPTPPVGWGLPSLEPLPPPPLPRQMSLGVVFLSLPRSAFPIPEALSSVSSGTNQVGFFHS